MEEAVIDVPLTQVAADAGGTLLATGADPVVTGVVIDSRHVSPGSLFVAIAGERVDGHSFAADVLRAGAGGVLIDNEAAARATGADPSRLILVENTQAALGALAKASLARVRQVGHPLVVGVTGSVGKTTTKDLLATVLASRGPIIAPPGSFNNEIGLPLTVLRAEPSTATLVLEMGADHVGNLEYLTDIAPLDIGVVLRVAMAHVGEFGGIDNVAAAKAELVAGILPGGTAVLNADDDRVAAMADRADRVLFYSSRTGADVTAEDVLVDEAGHPCFTLAHGDQRAQVRLGLVGEHHVANALAAATVAVAAGLPLDEVASSLSGLGAASPHRMDVRRCGDLTIIDDSYNANPESMAAALRTLAHIGAGSRTVAVLGTMLELGDESVSAHESIGKLAGQLGIDTVLALGCPDLARAARESGVEVVEAASRDEAIAHASRLSTRSGTILFKGSNGSKVWAVADAIKEERC